MSSKTSLFFITSLLGLKNLKALIHKNILLIRFVMTILIADCDKPLLQTFFWPVMDSPLRGRPFDIDEVEGGRF